MEATFHLVTEAGCDLVDDGVINALTGSTFFFAEALGERLRNGPDVVHFAIEPASSRVIGTALFAGTPTPVLEGEGAALAAAVQLAHHMGFAEVYLVAPEVATSRADEADLRRWHRLARSAFESDERRIFNTSRDALLDVHRRVDLYDLLVAPLLREYDRSQHATLDETEVISLMLAGDEARPKTMLDVGAPPRD